MGCSVTSRTAPPLRRVRISRMCRSAARCRCLTSCRHLTERAALACLQASGLALVEGKYYAVFDNAMAIGVLDDRFQFRDPANKCVCVRCCPGRDAAVGEGGREQHRR